MKKCMDHPIRFNANVGNLVMIFWEGPLVIGTIERSIYSISS